MTWNVTCTYSQFLAQKTPTCCVSLSSFYNDTIVPCPTCTCGCKNNGSHPGSCVEYAPITLEPHFFFFRLFILFKSLNVLLSVLAALMRRILLQLFRITGNPTMLLLSNAPVTCVLYGFTGTSRSTTRNTGGSR